MIINRYITKEVFSTLFAVTLVLLLAFICQQSVRYLNYVAVGKIPTEVLLKLISFEIPYLLALLLPLGLYLGIIIAFSRLQLDNEMAILQLCGFGRKHIFGLIIKIAAAIATFVLFLMIWVNPIISAKRQQLMTSDQATLHLIQTLIPGRFQASPDGKHVMYAEQLSRDHKRAKNVFLAQQRSDPNHPDQTNWMLVHAAEGFQEKEKETKEQFFVTKDGYRYVGTPGENDYQIIHFGKYEVRLPTTQAHNTHEDSESLSTQKLWKNYGDPHRAAELQWRFSIGVFTFLLALLAIPLSSLKPRQTRYTMLLPAILIYIIYINLLFVARHWIEQEVVSISLGMWWVHGLFVLLLIGFISLKSLLHYRFKWR